MNLWCQGESLARKKNKTFEFIKVIQVREGVMGAGEPRSRAKEESSVRGELTTKGFTCVMS